MAKEFQGVLFDILDEVIIDRAPVLRGTYAEAMADAEKLVEVVNAMFDGRVDSGYCYVLVDGVLVHSKAEA